MKSALARRMDALERYYGPPGPLPARGPFEIVLWENVAYLVDEETRARAFALLKKRIGLRPSDILAASRESLHEIASLGRMPEQRVEALRACAEVALSQGDLGAIVAKPPKDAIRILKKFPSIGEPGAEKILLFTRSQTVLALESNGLRVLLRLGYGKETKSYSATYRSVREAVSAQIPADCDGLIRAHLLLKRHGQEVCKRSSPSCEICPLSEGCAFAEGYNPAP